MKIKNILLVFCIPLLILPGASNQAAAQAAGNAANDSIRTFELKILNSDYSLGYFVLTLLTNHTLTISISSGRVEERDSILFTKTLQPSVSLRQLSETTISHLKNNYSNNCIDDGLQLTVTLKKDGKKKAVHVSNYYQEDIGKIIDLVNSIVPDKYRVWYNKDKLIADYKRCKGIK